MSGATFRIMKHASPFREHSFHHCDSISSACNAAFHHCGTTSSTRDALFHHCDTISSTRETPFSCCESVETTREITSQPCNSISSTYEIHFKPAKHQKQRARRTRSAATIHCKRATLSFCGKHHKNNMRDILASLQHHIVACFQPKTRHRTLISHFF